MIDRNEYFKSMINSTQIEKIEDKLQNELSADVASLWERVEKGKCWYPVRVFSIVSWNDDNYVLRIRRTDLSEDKHSFWIGNTVRIFNNRVYEKETKSIEGKITAVSQSVMSVRVDGKEYRKRKYDTHKSWLDRDDLAVEVVYNRKGYDKMKQVLSNIQKKPGDLQKQISEVLIGIRPPSKVQSDQMLSEINQDLLSKLNEPQRRAVLEVLNTADVSLILGPPGTGKTTTITHTVKAIVDAGLNGKKILVTAPSNTAVDLLATRINEMGGINVLRLGNTDKINEQALSLTLTGKIEGHQDFPLLDSLSNLIQRRYAEARRLGYKSAEGAKLIKKNTQDKQIRNRIYREITKQLYTEAQVIACTLEGSMSQELKKHYKSKFKYVFIDEAGQALEPMTWLPISKAERVVLIGDHHQLPPVVKSVETSEVNLNKSLFERVMDNGNVPHNLLSIQYRMHERIMNFSNRYFYRGELRAAPENRFHRINSQIIDQSWNEPFEFLDTASCKFWETSKRAISTKSTLNKGEATFLVKHLETFIEQFERHAAQREDNPLSIGIITPYREQLYFLEELVQDSDQIQSFQGLVVTKTVDGFQGQEQDVIYLSLVRSNTKKTIGFLREYRRMNVAITRAKKKLVIIGDGTTLAEDKFYQRLIEYAKKENSYYDAKQWIEDQGMTLAAFGIEQGNGLQSESLTHSIR